MRLSDIADFLTIINIVVGAVIFVSASVPKKVRAWLKSIFLECLNEIQSKGFNKKDGDRGNDNKEDGGLGHELGT